MSFGKKKKRIFSHPNGLYDLTQFFEEKNIHFVLHWRAVGFRNV